tara:strand:+ start:521 stop:1312 length:792 start_codon:yes stop_codon:yes gene_type:complete
MNKYSISLLLDNDVIKKIIKIFEKKDIELRLVGGSVRNAILKRSSRDFDFAANKHPDKIINVLKENNINYCSYAKKYGSIIANINDKKFEITSLRQDINQQGRHTEVLFTHDWEIDANRRDFTINAIYLTSEGKLIDYFDGLKDIKENRVKFIGNIEKRISEDYLRIFRYYRFLGIFPKPILIDSYEKILNSNFLNSFKNLSNDSIRVEILKMLKNPYPLNSFCKIHNLKEKNYWLKMTNKHFEQTKYNLGLKQCLNKVDKLF